LLLTIIIIKKRGCSSGCSSCSGNSKPSTTQVSKTGNSNINVNGQASLAYNMISHTNTGVVPTVDSLSGDSKSEGKTDSSSGSGDSKSSGSDSSSEDSSDSESAESGSGSGSGKGKGKKRKRKSW